MTSSAARILRIPSVRTLLRLFCVLFIAYWLGCALMVAATPRPPRYNCHGMTRQACLNAIQ
jgi:hypothetical protein